MALRIGELVGIIRADDSGWRSGLASARLRMQGFQRDTNGRLRDMNGRFRNEGELSGSSFGRNMLRNVSRTLRSGMSSAMNAGLSGLSSVANKISSNPYVAAIGAALAAGIVTTMLPLIGALLASAVIVAGGLTVVGLSAALLKDEPAVKKAAKSLVGTAKRVFKDAAKPMVQPLSDALKSLEQTAKDIAPQLRKTFAIVADSGLTKNLTDGLDKLVKNTLPGFNSMLADGQPVFEAFEQVLSDIGAGLGGFLKEIGKSGPDAAVGLRDLGSAIEGLLIGAGKLIGFLARMYTAVRDHVEQVIGAFRWLYNVLIGNSIIPDLINDIVRWFVSLPGRIIGKLSEFVTKVKDKFSSAKTRALSKMRELVDGAVRWLKGLPGRAVRAVSSLAPGLAQRAGDAGRRLVSAIRRKVDEAVRWVRGLPGRAVRAVSGLGSRLYNSGRSLIGGFIRGIRSKIGEVASAAASVVSRARDYFPFSPAKRGPFAGRGWTRYSGQALIKGFQQGISQQLPGLRSQLGALGDGMPGLGGSMALGAQAAGGSSLSGPHRILVDFRVTGGEDDVVRMIRKNVQILGGGDVQRALGGRG